VNAGAEISSTFPASALVRWKKSHAPRNAPQSRIQNETSGRVLQSIGGNDELVFDGDSFVFNSSGDLIAQAKGC